MTSSPSASESDTEERHRAPLAAQVELRAVGVGHHVEPADRDRRLLHEIAGQLGHRVVVAVRLVRLQHRELRRVRRVDALIAEVAVDLEDPLDAADHRALEKQLRRDSQIQIGVERIAVGHKRSGRRAAVQQLQHRRFDLDEALRRATSRADCAPPRPGCAPSPGPAAARSGRRNAAGPGPPRTAACAPPAADAAPWRSSPSASASTDSSPRRLVITSPVDADVVAQVDQALPGLQRAPAPTRSRESIACNSVPSPSRRVAKQSLPVLRTKITRPVTATWSPVAVSVGRSAYRSPDLRQRGGAGTADRVRLDALGEHPVPLLPADLHLLGKVVGGVHWHGVLLGHGTLPRHGDDRAVRHRAYSSRLRRPLLDNLPVMVDSHSARPSFGAGRSRIRPVSAPLSGGGGALGARRAGGDGPDRRPRCAAPASSPAACWRSGHEVVPVEPDPAMRAQLDAPPPAATALAGSAEAMPLPDAHGRRGAGRAGVPLVRPGARARRDRPGAPARRHVRPDLEHPRTSGSTGWPSSAGSPTSATVAARSSASVTRLRPRCSSRSRRPRVHATTPRSRRTTLVAMVHTRSYWLTPLHRRSATDRPGAAELLNDPPRPGRPGDRRAAVPTLVLRARRR